MNDVLTKYREFSPEDDRDDATLTVELGRAFESKGIDFGASSPEFAASYQTLKKLGQPSLAREFTKGVARGIDQTQSTYYGGAALVADSLGWEGGREWAMEGYERNQAQAAENPASVQSYKDVDGFGEGVRFVTGLAGEVAPSALESIGSGIVSGGVGAPIVKQFAKRAIKKRIGKEVTGGLKEKLAKDAIAAATKRGAARAATVGITASSVLQNAGETYGQLYDTAATRGDRIKASFAAGAVAGALDSAVPVAVLRRMLPSSVTKGLTDEAVKLTGIEPLGKQLDKAFEGYSPLKRKFLAVLAKDTGTEAITESLQELVQEVAQAYADPDYKFEPEVLRERLINAAIAGAVGGTQFGGASATLDTYRQSGTNRKLNELSKIYDQAMLAERASQQRAPEDLGRDLPQTNADIDAYNQALEELDLDITPEGKELSDLIAYVESQDAGGEGLVGAILKYQDPETRQWRNAFVRGDSIEQIVRDTQAQGIQNAEIVQVTDKQPASGDDPGTTDPVEPTAEERTQAEKQLKRDGVNLSEFTDEDRDSIVLGAVEDLRERQTVGTVPTDPEPTREALIEAMREEIAAIEADESLSKVARRDAIIEAELATTQELNAYEIEFTDEDFARDSNVDEKKTQDEGTNTPPVATESGQVTASPVIDPNQPQGGAPELDSALAEDAGSIPATDADPDMGIPVSETITPPLTETYSEFGFMPMEVLAERNLENELAAASTDFDSENNRVTSARFTRRAAVLRNTITGEIEVRGAYTAETAEKGGKEVARRKIKGEEKRTVDRRKLKGKARGQDRKIITLHGAESNQGIPLARALAGWKATDAKKNTRAQYKTDRDTHELVGIIEFDGSPVPFDAKDEAFFESLKEKQRKGEKITQKDQAKIQGITNRRGGYGNIFQTFPSEQEFLAETGGRIIEPRETMAERIERGEVDIVNPGEYTENLLSFSTEADEVSQDGEAEELDPEIFQVSEGDSELADPETLLTDEPIELDASAAMRTLATEHGMPAPEVEQALDELDSIESDGSLADIREVFANIKDFPVLDAFLRESGEVKYHYPRVETLIQLLYNDRRRTTAANDGSAQRVDRGAQAPVADLQQADREPGRPQGQGDGTAQAVPGSQPDPTADVSQRVGQRPDPDPRGTRSAGERLLEWQRTGQDHVAYAGNWIFSVTGGPEVWDLSIADMQDEAIVHSETFIGTSDQAILALEKVLADNVSRQEPKPIAEKAPARVGTDRLTSQTQPDRELPADKPRLVAIQGDRIPQVTDRIGDGYDLDAVGKQGVNLALAAHANGRPGFLNSDGTGVGKELHVEEPVLTENGWRPIGEIKPGDKVFGRDGELHNVTDYWPQGVKPLYRITFSDGGSVLAGLEHQWAVQTENDRARKKPYRVMTTNEILGGLPELDLTDASRGNRIRKLSIPFNAPINFKSDKDYVIPPYIMGVLIGDGCIKDACRIVPGAPAVAGRVRDLLPQDYTLTTGADYGTSTAYYLKYKNGRTNPMRDYIRSVGLDVIGDYKFIPDDYLYGDIESRHQLLSGILDTDGSYTGARVRYSSTSLRLVKDVQELSRSLGYLSRVWTVESKKPNEQPHHVVTVSNFDSRKSGVKSGNQAQETKHRLIESIKYECDGEAACISVDAPDALYITKDYIVTHNSRQAIAVMNEIANSTGGRILYVTENAQQVEKFQREMRAMGVSNPLIEFTTYTQIGTGKMRQRAFSAVVFDEAHNLKNATSHKSIGAARIKSDFTMIMTATPNDKVEAAAYFASTITGIDEETILNQIGLERVEQERKDETPYTIIQKLKDVTNAEIRTRLNELRNGLIAEGAMIRREYPFYGTRDVITMDLDAEARAELDQINSYWDAQENDSQRNQDLNRWLEAKKVDEIYNRAKDDLANGRSVVIVAETINEQWVIGLEGQTKKAATEAAGKAVTSTRKGLGQILADRFKADGIPFAKIYGTGVKTKAVDSFQSGDVKLAIMTPKSGGTGIDLDDQNGTAPRSVYIATMNFSGDVFEQIMGRFSRRNTMSPTKLSFVGAPEVGSEQHRTGVLKEKLETLATFQGKQAEDQDSDIRDLFSDAVLNAPSAAEPLHPVDASMRTIQSFNRTVLPESRINTTAGIDYEINRITQPTPFLVEKYIDDIAREFGADAEARVFIRNLLEAVPGEAMQTLDLRIVDDETLPAGRYDPARRLLILNKAAPLNQGNGVALAFTHEMGHFYINEVIGFDFAMDQWQSLSTKQRTAAWAQYLEAQGLDPKAAEGADLLNDQIAAQEWAAFQFTRIARSGLRDRDTLTKQMRKEGITQSLIEALTSWYDQLRQWIDQWVGNAELSTKDLDAVVMEALGIDSNESSMRADAIRQGEYLSRKANEAGYRTIDEFAAEDLPGFADATRRYRELGSLPRRELNSPSKKFVDDGPRFAYSLINGETTTTKTQDPRGNLTGALARQRQQDVRVRDGRPGTQERSERTLKSWAVTRGLKLHAASFDQMVAGKREFYGSEHTVYFDGKTGRVIKVTHLAGGAIGQSNTAVDYLHGLASANKLFNDDIRLEGILIRPDGIQIVTTQPYVKGRKAEPEEIQAYLEDVVGLTGNDVGDYADESRGIYVSDAVGNNAFAQDTKDGVRVLPFDFQVSTPESFIDAEPEWLDAPAGHRNPEIRKKLKDVERERSDALTPETTGRAEAGKRIVVENAWATHAELQQIATRIYDKLRRDKTFEGDFDTFYRRFTATPITPSEARQYLGSLEVEFDARERGDLENYQKRNVDDYLLAEVYETRKKLEARISDGDSYLRQKLKDIEKEVAKLQLHQENYNDAQALEQSAVDEMRGYLQGFKKAIGSKGGSAKLGKLGEIIRQLEGQKDLDNRIARKYLVGIERFLLSESPLELFNLIEIVADSDVSLSGSADKVRARFAEAGIAEISMLSNEEFAAVIAISKADGQLLNSILLRKLPDIEEKIAIVESEIAETKGDFKRAGKALTQIKKHAALKGRIAGHRALSKGRIARWKSAIKAKEAEQTVIRETFRHYDTEFNAIAGRVGGTVQGHVVDGTDLMIPADTSATREQILSGAKKFRYGITTAEDITRIIAAQKDWLQGPEAEQNRQADPLFYQQVQTQNARLVERTFKEISSKSQSFGRRIYFDSLANSFDKLNLAPARAVSQMLQKLEARMGSWNNEATTLGERSDKARYDLGRALGLDRTPSIFVRQFADRIDTPMKFYMEQPGASIREYIKERMPEADAATARLVEHYYEAELANAKFQRRVTETTMQQGGLGSVTNDRVLVPDYANEGKLTPIEQTHRNLGSGTFMIRPNEDAISILVNQFGDPSNIQQAIKDLDGDLDDESIDTILNNLFPDPEAYDRLVGALARKDKVPVFTGPSQGDLITREDATDAFNRAQTPADFFRALYAIEESPGSDMQTYQEHLSDQLSEISRLYNDIHKTEQKRIESREAPASATAGEHVAIDARKQDSWPSEWLSFRQGGATANNIIISQNVVASVFGKGGERLTREKVSILDELRKKALEAERAGDLKLKQNYAKEIERADRYFKQLEHTLGSQLGPLRDLKLGMEIMNTLVGGVLNGPRAAMVQLNQLYQPILHYGLSGTTFRMMKNQTKVAAQDLFGSFFEAMGITLFRDSEAFKQQKDLFGLDPEKTNGFFDFAGDMGNEGRVSGAQRKLRLFNILASRRGISRAKAEDALYSSFKPWAPFGQLIGALHKAPMIAMRAEFDRLAAKAIEHADRALPNGGDLTAVNFNHKTLGFRSKVEFDRLNTMLEEKVGTTLADVVGNHRVNRGGPPFSREQYLIMSSVGLDLMASEANVFTTRSPQLHTEMGKFVFPLLGWAIHQPHHAAKMFKGSEGEVTKRTIAAGVMTLGFGLVPAVMMMAVFEDWFDEHIMGKKRNLRPLTGAGPLGTANAVLERVTRNGMLGMPMELVNLGMNIGGDGDLRTASLDQRVFLASSIRSAIQIVGTAATQRAVTWDSVGRRTLQISGANGYLQQVDMFSQLLGLDNAESRTVARINAGNYLRVGGRMIGLEQRNFSGSMRPTRVTPWVTKMQVSAQANDAEAFQSAYQRAIKAARADGKTGPREAEDYVASSWTARHPLKGPFRTPPTPQEYQRLLSAIGENGARDVQEMVNQYNLFGTRIGAKPYAGKANRGSSPRTTMSLSQMAGINIP